MKTGIYWQDPKYAVGRRRTDPGCVLYLLFHRLDGASFMSKDAYGHLCTVTGALWTPRGRSFDGVDDCIKCGQDAGLDITEAITVEGWCKRTASTDGTLASRHDNNADATRAWYLNWISNNYVYFALHGIGTAYKFLYVSDRDWHHFVGTYDGEIVKLYTDTVLGTIVEGAGALQTPAVDTLVGAAYYNAPTIWRPFPGLIGEVRIYNRTLTPLEIQRNYLATKGRYQ